MAGVTQPITQTSTRTSERSYSTVTAVTSFAPPAALRPTNLRHIAVSHYLHDGKQALDGDVDMNIPEWPLPEGALLEDTPEAQASEVSSLSFPEPSRTLRWRTFNRNR